MLLAHADVEGPGDAILWKSGDPFSGKLLNGKIYGRGSGDDKHGMMINAMVPQILKRAGVRLKGDLIIGSLADEEQAGSNGAVALLAKGYRADGAIYLDGCNQHICISNLGGGYVTLHLNVPPPQTDAAKLIMFFERVQRRVRSFQKARSLKMAAHRHYRSAEFYRSSIRLFDIQLGAEDATCGRFKAWFYLLPGETPDSFKRQFVKILSPLRSREGKIRLEWMSRCVLPSEVQASHPLVSTITAAFTRAAGHRPAVMGSRMSDMGFINHYGRFPCLIFGANRWGKKGMVHQPDEYVVVRDVMQCLRTAVLCTTEWCGYVKP